METEISIKKDKVVRLIQHTNHIGLLALVEKILEDAQHELAVVEKYMKPMRQKTDLNELLKKYHAPDLSKVIGVLPNDEPIEKLLTTLG